MYKFSTIRQFVIWMLFTAILIQIVFSFPQVCFAEGIPDELYSQSAVLMDGKTGRVLYEKDGFTIKPMASTTKIMTCLLAVESQKLDRVLTVSSYAASQPDVQLNIKEGEQYILGDMLYSLMLESHNDTAVAIAEFVGSSVEGFAEMMNQRAKEMGAMQTYFISPNGLDEEDIHGIHSTTAYDLALIMSYAVKNEQFIKICQTQSFSFEDVNKTRSFQVHNKNAFLNQMPGVLAGKTGFTNKAGYCYVCAMENDGRLYIVALLACGWPGHKNYKWQDTRKLLNYGMEAFVNKEWSEPKARDNFFVKCKGAKTENWNQEAFIEGKVTDGFLNTLLVPKEAVMSVKVEKKEFLTAPVKENQKIAKIIYKVNNEIYKEIPVLAAKGAEAIDYFWCVKQLLKVYF
ncbi:MAG: D-alanyl-D-alanine carboxypeptidase [Lachnospiraceae bacterium]|nr:D-alanyl-D-alanine carboxypeptidase [Lachnospiraceae bacterium]MDD3614940.1 D-alanyl-D-alanine carboxypeptidase [Lachnospiraceae bacterium]